MNGRWMGLALGITVTACNDDDDNTAGPPPPAYAFIDGPTGVNL